MAILDFQQVSFVRDKNYLLKAINWQVKKNEHWAILGLNGAGKSLLLQMI
ncbi:ATP-binding cassette domain-containing protein, partial [Enterococcus faecium]